MLVTFTSKAGANVTMFGDVALQLLKLMGHSGTVPGALRPEDISAAIERLQAGLAKEAGNASRTVEAEEDKEPVVSLSTRAGPLLDLLRAAQAAGSHVMWDK